MRRSLKMGKNRGNNLQSYLSKRIIYEKLISEDNV